MIDFIKNLFSNSTKDNKYFEIRERYLKEIEEDEGFIPHDPFYEDDVSKKEYIENLLFNDEDEYWD